MRPFTDVRAELREQQGPARVGSHSYQRPQGVSERDAAPGTLGAWGHGRGDTRIIVGGAKPNQPVEVTLVRCRGEKSRGGGGGGEGGESITKGGHLGAPRNLLPGAQPTEQWLKQPHGTHITSVRGSVPNALWKLLGPFPVAEPEFTC